MKKIFIVAFLFIGCSKSNSSSNSNKTRYKLTVMNDLNTQANVDSIIKYSSNVDSMVYHVYTTLTNRAVLPGEAIVDSIDIPDSVFLVFYISGGIPNPVGINSYSHVEITSNNVIINNGDFDIPGLSISRWFTGADIVCHITVQHH